MKGSDHRLETAPARNDPSMMDSVTAFQEKPVKAIIGLGMLIAFSLLLYEINRSWSNNSSPPSTMQRLQKSPSPPVP